MPDFGKALKRMPLPLGEAGTAALKAAVPGEGFNLADQLKFLRSRFPRRPTLVATGDLLPPRETQSTRLGAHYVIHASYPGDYFHGKIRLSRLSMPDLDNLMKVMNKGGCDPQSETARDRIVFLDTETTGVQGGTGICPFLVGLGYFEGDDFHMHQFFIRDFDEEPSMLLAAADLLARFDLVITYNGAAFDIPLMETRFTLARLDSPFQRMSHFDLLCTARRLWRSGHGSCRLTALEHEILSFLRGPDVPGAMIPRAYFDYLQRRPSAVLRSVFTHNVYDVVSLAALTIEACDRVIREPAQFDDPLDLYSLGRVMENSENWRRSIQLYEMALAGGLTDPVRQKALENLAVLYRRMGDQERSVEICQELMGSLEFSMTGYEGAAIYHERVAHNFEAALRILEEGLARTDTKRWKMLLKARWDRLQQKVMQYGD